MGRFDAIGSILDGAVGKGAVPGAAVVLAGPEGQVYEGYAGVLSDGGARVSTDTLFRFASLTKSLVSAAVLQLVEAGKLDGLDQEVRSVVPEWGELQVLEGWDGDTPQLRAPASQATLRHLLTHTGGLAYFFTHAESLRWHEVHGIPHVLSGEKRSLFEVPLVADPGTAWAYGPHTDWLGLVVEAASGQRLGDYLTEHVLTPLGMTDTTFSPSEEQRARLMPIHHRTPDGSLVTQGLELPPDPEFQPGGHGLYGTARDYGRWLTALLSEGGGVLSPESVELMFTDQLGGAVMPTEIVSADPTLSNDVPFLQGVPVGWGAGLHLTLMDLPGMRRSGTGDWAGIFNLYYWVDRGSGLGGVVLTQVLPFFDPGVVELAVGAEQAAYAGLAVPA